MDIKVGLSIYNKPWLIEPSAALQMLDFWERVKAGEVSWNYRRAKSFSDDDIDDEGMSAYSIYSKFFSKERVVMAPDNSYDMRSFLGFDGAAVAIIPVSGPLMKSDFCGSFGTGSLRQLTQLAGNTKSVQTILFAQDSPGGTVDGNEAFANTIKNSPKQTISLIDGMSASASYWLSSACDQIFASSNTDIVGSIGTMCSWYDNTKAMEDRGVVLREYYATDSKDKNKAFNDANKGDGKKLVKEMLDPLNSIFTSAVQQNRQGKIDTKKENVLTGNTYVGAKALDAGLIDGIKPMEEAIEYALQSSTKKKSTQKTTKMANKNTTPFANTIAASGTDAFAVVDGGFMATEEQLENVEAHINALNSTIANQSLKLQAQADGVANLDAIQQKLDAANTRITALEGEANTKDEQITALEGQLAEAQKLPGAKFAGAPGKTENGGQDGGTAQLDYDAETIAGLDSTKTADRLLG